ncbi:MAG: type II toxin-antitoxin system RelE/ParE family toxin [Elstera sp.]
MSREIQAAALARLELLEAVRAVEDLRLPPSNRLEKLGGDRAGQWSIRVNRQWLLCFDWRDGHAWNVELVDYH